MCIARGQRGDRQDEHREGEHQSEGASVVGGEALATVLDTADHERQPEHQQGVGENRADDGGLHHVVKARPECEHDDEQFGQVPQRRLQYPSGVGPEPVSERLHRTADQRCQRGQRKRGHDERQHGIHVGEVQDSGGHGRDHRDGEHDAVAPGQQREPFGMGGRHGLLLL